METDVTPFYMRGFRSGTRFNAIYCQAQLRLFGSSQSHRPAAVARCLQASIFHQGLRSNTFLLGAIVFMISLAVLLSYTPPLQVRRL